MTAVVVGGALANKPGSGGEAWVRLSWIRGLQRLGLDVWFVEELDPSLPADPDAPPVAYFRSVTARFGLADRATLIVGGDALVGPTVDDLVARAATATLVNISGHVAHRRLFPAFRKRVLVDIDPGFTQLWHAAGDPGARVAGHEVCFTIGEHIGSPGCPIPTGGVEWLPVRQPVVLPDWPCVERAGGGGTAGPAGGGRLRFTTVGNWRGPFGPIELDGRRYGLKVHEFRKFIQLPSRSPHRFELALRIDAADRTDIDALHAHGWQLTDPHAASAGPDEFRAYVQRSHAEFSVAQGIYVDTRSGWFSDRTVRYLASGKPALVQDTGFGDLLPVGEGLVAFRTIDEAVAAAADIAARYDEHAGAAREIAERHFDSDHVLARFCEQAGIES
jgi:hypothetical protein